MSDLIQTDNAGNNYRLIRTIDSTNWETIRVMFKELFNRNYGNYEGQVLATTSCYELDGTVRHNFGGGKKAFVDMVKVVIKPGEGTEFWEHFGEAINIFDLMREKKEYDKLVSGLVDGLSMDELRRAKIVLEDSQ